MKQRLGTTSAAVAGIAFRGAIRIAYAQWFYRTIIVEKKPIAIGGIDSVHKAPTAFISIIDLIRYNLKGNAFLATLLWYSFPS